MEGKENRENRKRFRDTPEEDVQPSADSRGRCGCRTGTEEGKKVSETDMKINEQREKRKRAAVFIHVSIVLLNVERHH